MNAALLHEQHHKGQQSIEYVALYSVSNAAGTGHKLRIDLRRDSYDFQSHGKVEVFSNELSCWKYLASLPYSTLTILTDKYVEGSLQRHTIAADVKRLLRQAELILYEDD